jgi:hypothetical protein
MPECLTCADTLAVREERAADAQGKAQLAALEEKEEVVAECEAAVKEGVEQRGGMRSEDEEESKTTNSGENGEGAEKMNPERVDVDNGDEDEGNHGGDSDDQSDPTQLAGDRTSQHPQLQEARAKETGKEDEHKGQLGAGKGGRSKGGPGGAGIKVVMLPGFCGGCLKMKRSREWHLVYAVDGDAKTITICTGADVC